MAVLLQVHDKADRGGGIARVVADIGAGMTARGWQVRDLPLSHSAEADAPRARLRRRAGAADAAVAAVAAAAAGADAVCLHLGFTALSPDLVRAAAARAPLFVALHDVTPFCPNGSRLTWPSATPCARPEGPGCYGSLCAGAGHPLLAARRAYRWPARHAVWTALVREATALLAPSSYLAALAVEAGARPGSVVVAPHAVPFAGEATAARAASACPAEILYVGLLSRQKGAPLLLEAFARLSRTDARLTLIGDGPEAAALADRARTLGVAERVRLTGSMDRTAVRQALTGARVFAHPSLIPEGLGLSGIEAMALARPVVGFGRGGSADWLIDGETGLVVADPTPQGLARALDRVIGDDALADRLGGAAQAHVRRLYAPDAAFDRLSDLFAASATARVRP